MSETSKQALTKETLGELSGDPGRFPDWGKCYEEQPVEKMPWFCADLDPDLDEALGCRSLAEGSFLNIGTGPGTQAAQLQERGFDVTATDISASAVARAKKRYPGVNFVQDDVLQTKLETQFDLAFDRSCFPVLTPESRTAYALSLAKLVKANGYFFLKCFSAAEPERDFCPWRFSEEMIRDIFSSFFAVEEVESSEFSGALNPAPKALFVAMRRL